MRAGSPLPSNGPPSGLGLDRVWAILAVAVPAIGGLVVAMSTVDLAYHVRLGELILHGSLPRTDVFTFAAPGAAWVDQQWGAQAIMALVYRIDGWNALLLLRSALIGLSFGLVFQMCRSAGASPRAASGLTVAGFLVSAQNLAMRPQLIAVALFATVSWISSTRREHPQRLWAIPVIVAIWANVHGSFVLGPLLLGLDWLEDRRERRPDAGRTFGFAMAATAATLANPFGIGVWTYLVDISTNPIITRFASEWEATSIRTFSGIALFVWVAAIAWFFSRRREAVPWTTLLKLGVFFLLALPAIRGIAWWGLVAPVIVAGLLAPARRRGDGRQGSPALNLVLVLTVAAGAIVAMPWWRGTDAATGRPRILWEAPEGLVIAAEGASSAGDRIWVDQAWASWFEFRLPDRSVFVDSRIELFPEAVWHTYLDVANGREGWQAVLDREEVDLLVLNPRQSQELIDRVALDPTWERIYRDPNGSVFARA